MKSEDIVKIIGGIVLLVIFFILIILNLNTGVCDSYVTFCPIAGVATLCLFIGISFITWGVSS